MKSSIHQTAPFVVVILFIALAGCQAGQTAPPETVAASTAVPPTAVLPTAASPAQTSPAALPAENKITIGVILFMNDSFFETAALGMEEA
ncbi:MAG TPA: hypothetical protein EYP41_19725, partial [Anaerolineae bacterium]|nr:hypothetical protein [Anaerolineae bacterium]